MCCVKKKQCGVFLNLLACFQLIIALITDSNIELEAHYWNIDAIAGAFVANSSATMAAMMLSDADLFCFHHGS